LKTLLTKNIHVAHTQQQCHHVKRSWHCMCALHVLLMLMVFNIVICCIHCMLHHLRGWWYVNMAGT
jgi:hypothetical protein